MIIPVGINHVIRGWPRITLAIIAACTVVHIYSAEFAPSAEDVQRHIAAKVAELAPDADDAAQQRVADDIERYANKVPSYRFGYRDDSGVSYRLVTCAFVHSGWLHLIGNMLFLWLAGAALEDRWGRLRFAAFYASGAVVSALAYAAIHTGSAFNLVGASGAVSALMGAFLVVFARMRIHFVYWLGRGFGAFEAAAYVALPLWFGAQLADAWWDSQTGASGVAFTAHIVGFLFGVVIAVVAKLIARRTTGQLAVAAPLRPPPIRSSPAPQPRAPVATTAEPPADSSGGPRFLR